MGVRAALAKPLPRRGLLLRHPDHHDPEAALTVGLVHVPAGRQFLGLALLEMHHRNPIAIGEPVDRPDIRGADLPQRGRRGDRKPAIQQEPHHLPLALQLRDVAGEEDPIDGVDLERDPLPE
jgi:hypothetical protein